MKKKIFCLFVIYSVHFVTIQAQPAAAARINDGYRGNKKISSEYFTVYAEDTSALNRFEYHFTVPSSIDAIVPEPTVIYDTGDVGGELDVLYLAIAEILDIHIKKFHCNVKVCSDAASLARISERLFGRTVRVPAFYVVDNNTIYVDASNISINVLGHELAHALQNEYFVVPPPVKIQEVLSGYVEYQLRKYAH